MLSINLGGLNAVHSCASVLSLWSLSVTMWMNSVHQRCSHSCQQNSFAFKSSAWKNQKSVKAIHAPSETVPAFPADGIDLGLYHFLRKSPILCLLHVDVCRRFCLFAAIKADMLIVCISPFSCYWSLTSGHSERVFNTLYKMGTCAV